MTRGYTSEKNVLMLISLLKQHNVKKIIASPGTTNLTLIGSIQFDDYFEVYSAADERSAAYMACGLAAETGEAVALSCTGATASRNYIPGLTEAFYRKLPVLAITSAQHIGRISHNIAQVIDRTAQLNDMVNLSVQIPTIHSAEDEWSCNININRALLALTRRGGGPVHINLTTTYSRDFSIKSLPDVRVVNRYTFCDTLPKINTARIGIFVGAHLRWTDELLSAVDQFCEKFNAVILCDHTSNYKGEFKVLPHLTCAQSQLIFEYKNYDLLIDIGDVSGAYLSLTAKEVWRVNPDGEARDTYKKLTKVFEMNEETFFKEVVKQDYTFENKVDYLSVWNEQNDIILKDMPELPFSNVWIAKNTASLLPERSVIHFGILNSLRSWNFFEIPNSVLGFANTGGFGIDGGVSSLIGASLANTDKLYFGVVGDLAFFYDMNSIGNRHVANNLRLMIVNNGKGTEFRNYNHPAARFDEDADEFMAAARHYGNKSDKLVKNYAENLGFEYLSAKNKDEYLNVVKRFTNPEITEKPIILEVFTDSQNESDALHLIHNIAISAEGMAKNIAKNLLGEKGTATIKKILKR